MSNISDTLKNLKTIPESPHESIVVPLAGTISATSHTIPVVNANDLWPAPNEATIFDMQRNVSETIYYGGKTATTFTGVVRGFENRTTARRWEQWHDSKGRPMVNVTNALSSSLQAKIKYNMELFRDAVIALDDKVAGLGGEGLENIESDIVEIQGWFADLLNRVEELELGGIGGADIQEIQDDIAHINIQITTILARLGIVETDLAALKAQIEADLQALDDKIDAVASLIGDGSGVDLSGVLAEIAGLAARLAAIESLDLPSAAVLRDELVALISDLQDQIDNIDMSSVPDDLVQALADLNAAIADIKSDIGDIEVAIGDFLVDSDLEPLREAVDNINDRLDSIESEKGVPDPLDIGTINASEAATVPTMPITDESENAASTQFVHNVVDEGLSLVKLELTDIQQTIDDVLAGKIRVDPDSPHTSLADITDPQENLLYWVGTDGHYEIFMWVDGAWKSRGTTDIDLTPYIKFTDIGTAVEPARTTMTQAQAEAGTDTAVHSVTAQLLRQSANAAIRIGPAMTASVAGPSGGVDGDWWAQIT